MNPSISLPRFRTARSPLDGTRIAPVESDPQLRGVPEAIRSLSPGYWHSLIQTSAVMDGDNARLHEALIEVATMHFRLYLSIACLSQTPVERMIVRLAPQPGGSFSPGVLVLRSDVLAASDPELHRQIGQVPMVLLLETVPGESLRAQARAFSVRSRLITPAIVCPVVVNIEAVRVGGGRLEIRTGIRSDMVFRDPAAPPADALEGLVPVNPILNLSLLQVQVAAAEPIDPGLPVPEESPVDQDEPVDEEPGDEEPGDEDEPAEPVETAALPQVGRPLGLPDAEAEPPVAEGFHRPVPGAVLPGLQARPRTAPVNLVARFGPATEE